MEKRMQTRGNPRLNCLTRSRIHKYFKENIEIQRLCGNSNTFYSIILMTILHNGKIILKKGKLLTLTSNNLYTQKVTHPLLYLKS